MVTADRSYGQTGVEEALHELRLTRVIIPHKAKPSTARRKHENRSFPRQVTWRTGSERKAESARSNATTAETAVA